jgi:hypothetical protein
MVNMGMVWFLREQIPAASQFDPRATGVIMNPAVEFAESAAEEKSYVFRMDSLRSLALGHAIPVFVLRLV